MDRRIPAPQPTDPAMSALPPLDHDELILRIGRDLADSYDEELELEIEDRDHGLVANDAGGESEEGAQRGRAAEQEYRRTYFRDLFRLQAELVKLQDWV